MKQKNNSPFRDKGSQSYSPPPEKPMNMNKPGKGPFREQGSTPNAGRGMVPSGAPNYFDRSQPRKMNNPPIPPAAMPPRTNFVQNTETAAVKKKLPTAVIFVAVMVFVIAAVIAGIFFIKGRGKDGREALPAAQTQPAPDSSNDTGTDSKPSDSQGGTESGGANENTPPGQYDDSNVGEIYCAPVEEEHIAFSEDGVSMYADNEVLVVSKPGVPKAQIETLAASYGAEIVGYIEQTGDYQWKLNSVRSESELEKLQQDILNSSLVDEVGLNYISNISEDTINIGSYYEEHLTDNDVMWGINTINAPVAWGILERIPDKRPVNVGLIERDMYTHEDLGFADIYFKTDSGNDHGTHVAGTFAARGDNPEGICGVYPYGNERLYGVCLNGIENHSENTSEMSKKVACAELLLRNVKVINFSQSYGIKEWYDKLTNEEKDQLSVHSLTDAYNYILTDEGIRLQSLQLAGFLNRLIQSGFDFVIVCSAGNDSEICTANSAFTMINDQTYKNIYDRIIVVGSITKRLNISDFSNYGERVDIFAPGEKIFSTLSVDRYGNTFKNEKNEVKYWSGTSMASPHVAGVAADVWTANPNLSGDEVKKIIKDSVLAISKPEYPVIDAAQAVQKALSYSGSGNSYSNYGAVMGWTFYDQVGNYNKDDYLRLSDCIITVYEHGSSEALVINEDKRVVLSDDVGHFELLLPAGNYDIKVISDEYGELIKENIQVTANEVCYEWFVFDKKSVPVSKPDDSSDEAAKYAQIVMDNEDKWLDRLNNAYLSGGDPNCWFEDIDFDGKLEFIVGGCSMVKDSYFITYLIYKFDGNKMILDGENEKYGDVSFLDFPFSSPIFCRGKTSPNPGLQSVGYEVIKNKDGSYDYLTGSFDRSNESFEISKLYYKNYKHEYKHICGYSNYLNYECSPDFHIYYDNIQGKEIANTDKSELISFLNDYFDGVTRVNNKIGTIPCTYLTHRYGAEAHNAIINGTAQGLPYISGCYDLLSKEEKKKALINSYNAYTLEETNDKPNAYNRILQNMKNGYPSSLKGKSELKEIMSEYGIIGAWEFHDYDNNGTYEAFALIVDREEEEDRRIQSVYYINSKGIVTLVDNSDFECQYKTGNYLSGYQGFFYSDMGARGSGWRTILYSVRNDVPYELNLSRKIQGFFKDDNGFYTTENDFSNGFHQYPEVELIFDRDTGEFKKGERR